MNRRIVNFDYKQRCIYMITMTVEGRRPLFGRVVGNSDVPQGLPDAPHVELTPLGQAVEKAWNDIPQFHPEIRVLALQMMPDHLHGILFVERAMRQPLGKVINGFKIGCNRAYRELGGVAALQQHTERSDEREKPGAHGGVAALQQHTERSDGRERLAAHGGVAALQQHTERTDGREGKDGQEELTGGRNGRPLWRDHGLLFSPGFNDKILWRKGELEAWEHYLEDNPRRLMVKRQHPDYFRVRHQVKVGGVTFDALGNLFLLQYPRRLQVQCSRSLTEEEIAARCEETLAEAKEGAVLVSPSISLGERTIMRAAFGLGLPLIVLRVNGITELSKPQGRAFDACAKGQLLIVAPWQHHNEQLKIKRGQCLELNETARFLSEY